MTPRIFSALARASTESWCLPALCIVSPSARNFLTSDIWAALSFGFFASASSIAFICFGKETANALLLASARLSATIMLRNFIGFSFDGCGWRFLPRGKYRRCHHAPQSLLQTWRAAGAEG